MSAIIIQQCPECRKNKEEIPRDQWVEAADPNCSLCKGSGHNEVDKEKRLALDREIDDMLDKLDEEERLIEEAKTPEQRLEDEIERIKVKSAADISELRNKFARSKLREIRRNKNPEVGHLTPEGLESGFEILEQHDPKPVLVREDSEAIKRMKKEQLIKETLQTDEGRKQLVDAMVENFTVEDLGLRDNVG